MSKLQERSTDVTSKGKVFLCILLSFCAISACSESSPERALARFRGNYVWQTPSRSIDPPGTLFGSDWIREFYGYNANKFSWRKLDVEDDLIIVNDGELVIREYEVLEEKILLERDDGHYLLDFSDAEQPRIVHTNEGTHPYELRYRRVQ
ncbi:MAG: hypothetical protein GY847_09760 [Proteobacteria bacterium]|nr:hypothetical protein [Pseudomonadota bacterium]